MPTDHLPSCSCPSSPLMAVAVDRCHGFSKPPSSSRRCRLRSFPHPSLILFDPEPTAAATGIPLRPTARFSRSLSASCLYSFDDGNAAVSTAGCRDVPRRDQIARLEIVAGRRSHTVHALVVEAAIALASGATPVPVADGVSTAHYLFNRFGESFAVVKPMDEDVVLPLQGGSRPGPKQTTQASEIGVREVAAYLLDHGAFAGVPPTALVVISHPFSDGPAESDGFDEAPVLPLRKIASIQRFVPHEFDAGELGPSRFSVASVHRVGILDVRILNVDRHAGNILVKKGRCCCYGGSCGAHDSMAELVPIDHGLCLPEIINDPYFEWLHWPQASEPFSDAEAEYVASLDPLRDVELLRTELPLLKESSLRILLVCTTFLKSAVAAGLCLADIGHMLTREFTGLGEEPSEFEALCKRVDDSMKSTTLGPEEEEEDEEGRRSDDVRDDGGGEDEDEDGSSDGGSVKEHKVGGSMMSNSSSDMDESRSISFEGLSEEEWRLFMEGFERLLPEALEARKRKGSTKQSLGTSCKF